MNFVETLNADLARTSYRVSRWTLSVWRTGQWLRQTDRTWWRPFALRACKLVHFLWIDVLVGAELPTTVQCGPGLRLAHGGRGVVINHKARIGANCVVYHGVTIGGRGGKNAAVPVIGDNVYIGAGALVLGPITIGDGARIGAGSVVVDDVPAGASVVGVPARLVSASRES